jgi:hypothetical protein
MNDESNMLDFIEKVEHLPHISSVTHYFRHPYDR